MLYLCELIEENVVKKRFYREGNSAHDVEEQLDFFEWPSGEWRIVPAEQDEDK